MLENSDWQEEPAHKFKRYLINFQDWKEIEVMSAFWRSATASYTTSSFLQNKPYIMADPNSPLQSKEDTDHVRFNDIASILDT